MPSPRPAPEPAHGHWFMTARVRFRVARRDNADGVSVVEHVMAEGFGPPLHVHRDEDELFHVVRGELRVRCGDEVSVRGPGSVFCLPRGVPHGFRVASPDGARMLTVTRGGFEDMLRAASRPAGHDGLPEQRPPSADEQASLFRLCAEHGIDLVGPPID